MGSYFLFTEIPNCGKIGKIALKSFHKYHNLKINIFGNAADFDWIEDHPNNVYHLMSSEEYREILKGYTEGHLGTAMLWAHLIIKRPEDYFIHVDSDNIFRGDVVNDIVQKIEEGYDLIGSTRNYKNNPQNDDYYRQFSDVVSTNCFAFNKARISARYTYDELCRMIRGTYNPLGHNTLDFFDPVSFDILKNDGRIANLDFNDVGGCNKEGSRDNCFKELNNEDTAFKIEFGRKLAHFSGVGSGMHFFNNKKVNVPQSYIDYCLDRYALFCKIFYNEDIGISVSQYKNLLSIKEWF